MLTKLRDNAALAALVVALLALFVALGGIAGALPGKKSVDKNDLKKNVVVSKNVAPDALTGADVNEKTLNLPSDALPGVNFQSSGPIKFGKDGFGIVHLAGNAAGVPVGGTITTLPAGFRPAASAEFAAPGGFSSLCEVEVDPNGAVRLFGNNGCNPLTVAVDGVTFPAA